MARMSRRIELRFPDDLSDRLTQIAQREGRSVASLIREAVVERYGSITAEERLAAIDRLADLEAPVGSWDQMEAEIIAGALGTRARDAG